MSVNVWVACSMKVCISDLEKPGSSSSMSTSSSKIAQSIESIVSFAAGPQLLRFGGVSVKPVQFRVIICMRQWAGQNYVRGPAGLGAVLCAPVAVVTGNGATGWDGYVRTATQPSVTEALLNYTAVQASNYRLFFVLLGLGLPVLFGLSSPIVLFRRLFVSVLCDMSSAIFLVIGDCGDESPGVCFFSSCLELCWATNSSSELSGPGAVEDSEKSINDFR